MTERINAALIAMVAAMGENRVIGSRNALPWRLPADLKHFKRLTLGKPVVMGRTTFESIGRPLPGRRNIIISGDRGYQASGCEVVTSPEEALHRTQDVPEIMVIGGASLYAQMLPRASRLYLTFVHGHFDGDAFFPPWDDNEWQEVSREAHEADAENPHAHSFVVLERCPRR
jgi:dihydrofolate reductase